MPAASSSPARLHDHLDVGGVTGPERPVVDLDGGDLVGLFAALGAVGDFRSPRGRRHALLPVLVLAVWAVAAGARSYVAIADHARYAATPDLALIGMSRAGPPPRAGGRRVGVPSQTNTSTRARTHRPRARS